MKITDLKPSFADILSGNLFPVDVWEEYQARYGIAHKRISAGYNGEKPRLLKPAAIDRKYKNRLFRSGTTVIDNAGTILFFDAHYGRKDLDGYTIRHVFTPSGDVVKTDISRRYHV